MQKFKRMSFVAFFLFSILWIPAHPAQPRDEGMPAILSLKDQARMTAQWLKPRLDKILPDIMRREKIDMWVVICREYNEDPVYFSLAGKWTAKRMAMLVFFDRGKEGIEKLAISRSKHGVPYRDVLDIAKEDPWQCLARIIKERDPNTIGINESETFSLADGLSASLKKKFVDTIGPRFASRLGNAERVALGWLETRIPEELEVYPQIVAITHCIIAEAFSRRVITPGTTTTDDVVWWIGERIRELGLARSFSPEITLLRFKEGEPKDQVIHRGDVVHCDMGISYLNLKTDLQETAYVLKEGEMDAPQGLKDAMALGNKAQDILAGEFKEGRTGNEILALALKKTREQGLRASIYCHPLGFHVHAAGPTIGLWDMQEGVPGWGDYPLFRNTCHAIELDVLANIPEWENQEIRLALEQDAVFTGSGVYYLDGRQTKLHLIR